MKKYRIIEYSKNGEFKYYYIQKRVFLFFWSDIILDRHYYTELVTFETIEKAEETIKEMAAKYTKKVVK